MKAKSVTTVAAIALIAGCSHTAPKRDAPAAASTPATAAAPAPAKKGFAYPSARESDQVDDYHGTKVADPYRWLEDLDSPETRAWVEAENKITESYLSTVPSRDKIKQRLTELWNYERYASDRGGLVPVQRGDRLFYSRNDGLQNQFVVYVQDGLGGTPRVLLDPNGLSKDGTVALSEMAVSDDGKLFAYSLSDGGSDWRTIKVRDVASGKDRDDEVKWAKFTDIAWNHGGTGFYYSRYEEPKGENALKAVNKNHKVYFHRIGTPQDKDTLVFERPQQPEMNLNSEVSDDGRYLVISGHIGTDVRNALFYKDLKSNGPVVTITDTLDASYGFAGNVGTEFVVRTNKDADTSRVIGIDVRKPDPKHWRRIVDADAAALVSVSLVDKELVLEYLRDARSSLHAYKLSGQPTAAIELPGLGTVAQFRSSSARKTAFFAYSDFITPWSLYRYDSATHKIEVFKQPKTAFDASKYETRQVFFQSKDGTKVPMFVTAKKGLALDGNNPTILYGYGGFDISVTPTYSANTAAWLEMGGVYASANLRGGGEYGQAWHEAGMKTHKQNVFDDFASAARYLIAQKYTQPKKLAISGRSNGGLLVGATMLQHPELFGCALPAVGVMDMLRFRDFTIGWAWEADYGSVRNADEFAAIRAYSPLHNLKRGVEYPPTLITTADHDDRVFPAHSFKFAAALQKAYTGDKPMLIRIETRAGHGAGKPTAKIIEEQADIYAFVVKSLGM